MQDTLTYRLGALSALEGKDLMCVAIREIFARRVAVVSSFGTESAVLLAMAAEIDRDVPVLFLDTGRHFPETIAYRDQLVDRLGLRNVTTLRPDAAEVRREDPAGGLAAADPDACCAMRKVAPLALGLHAFDAWISGRKRYQSGNRAALPLIEQVDGKVKLNPLARWSAADVAAAHVRRGLPAHPLAAYGFRSIGCAPCTRAVAEDEDVRAGRWSGTGKTECGIHRSADGRLVRAAR
jgi:phosphoadenosine phosphosulfate reductase